MIMIYH